MPVSAPACSPRLPDALGAPSPVAVVLGVEPVPIRVDGLLLGSGAGGAGGEQREQGEGGDAHRVSRPPYVHQGEDDTDASVNPDASEVPYDGIDQDCSGADAEDLDGDGYASTEDCDDTDPTVNPDAEEKCDGVDQDCDGEVDEAGGDTWYVDADGDGYGDPATASTACEPEADAVADGTDCDDSDPAASPAGEEVCDEVDNDCDGLVDEEVTTTWYIDRDGDGWGTADTTQDACAVPTGYSPSYEDCDDTTADVSPDADERCDGVDQDCDGEIDEGEAVDAPTWYADTDGDGYGDPDSAVQSCEVPDGYVANDLDCDDTDATRNPDTIWYIDFDSDGYGSDTFTTASCEQPVGWLPSADDCDDTETATHPGATEVCNEADDDCDGLVDDDDDSLDTSTTDTWYADTDGDTYGDAAAPTDACAAPAGTVVDDTDRGGRRRGGPLREVHPQRRGRERPGDGRRGLRVLQRLLQRRLHELRRRLGRGRRSGGGRRFVGLRRNGRHRVQHG
jgi:hypothetical protein